MLDAGRISERSAWLPSFNFCENSAVVPLERCLAVGHNPSQRHRTLSENCA